MIYKPVKLLNPRQFQLSRFMLNVYTLHMHGKTVSWIADYMGVDEESVEAAIVTVWEMDNPKATVCEGGMTVSAALRNELRGVK